MASSSHILSQFDSPEAWLRSEFVKRKKINPRYSLRGFARLLELPPGRVSEILSEKRFLTPRLFEEVIEQLGVGPSEKRELESLFKRSRSYKKMSDGFKEAGSLPFDRRLKEDEFELLVDPMHFALLSLINTKDFKSKPEWIAKRLGVTLVEAVTGLKRLQRLKLIEENDGRLVRTSASIATSTDIPSKALRNSHRKTLLQAVEALETVDVELRSIRSFTMAIDTSKLKEAKVLIKDFEKAMENLLENGQRTEVYNLNVQLVPVTTKRKSK